MKLSQGHHLAYCTNVHRGNNWKETFFTRALCNAGKKIGLPGQAHMIGLRLGADAAEELSQPDILKGFKTWLDEQNAYTYH